MKPILLIVEGKSDTNKLKSLYPNVETFETNGLGLNEEKILFLLSIKDDYHLVVFTDPDTPGEIIRKKLIDRVPNLSHIYLPNNKALSLKKNEIGVEHASGEDIRIALDNLYSHKSFGKYEMEDLVDLGIYENKKRRFLFCDYLHIAYGNNKKVLNQLNYFNIDPKKIKEFTKENNVSK